jgi:hypothetical protein
VAAALMVVVMMAVVLCLLRWSGAGSVLLRCDM